MKYHRRTSPGYTVMLGSLAVLFGIDFSLLTLTGKWAIGFGVITNSYSPLASQYFTDG